MSDVITYPLGAHPIMNIYENIYGEGKLRDKIFDCILPTFMLFLRDERMLCSDEQLFKLGDHKNAFIGRQKAWYCEASYLLKD